MHTVTRKRWKLNLIKTPATLTGPFKTDWIEPAMDINFGYSKTIHMMTRTSTPDDNVKHDLDPFHEWASQNKLDWTTTNCTITTPATKS